MIYFGMATTADKRKTGSAVVSVFLPIELKNRLVEESKRDDRSIRAQVVHILKKHYGMNLPVKVAP